MAKYSFHSKNSKESLKVINANSKAEAVKYFAKLKVLPEDKFLELYEVTKGRY
jgi:hypothetical protein